MDDKMLERLVEAAERIADALELMDLEKLAQARMTPANSGAYVCTRCERTVITRADHAEDCPERNPHPAQLMPAPKGYMCPACGHGTYGHREHGCDSEGCDCPAPFGRVMPGDPQ